MSQYEPGLQTKNRILSACRELFYEKGYDNTTFVDIARAASVNQGSIYYHFTSKEKLLSIIMDETILKNDSIINMYSDDDILFYSRYFIGGKLYLYKMYNDEKYRRFNLDATHLLNAENYHQLMELVMLQERVAEDAPLIKRFEGMANMSFDVITRIFFVNEMEKYTVEEIHSAQIEIFRRILKIDDDQFKAIQVQIDRIDSMVPWEKLDTTLDPERLFIEG